MARSQDSSFFDTWARQDGVSGKCFIIAEAGVNHNGDMQIARDMIRAAKSCGADAVKFQTFQAKKLCTRDASKAEYQKENEPTAKKEETQFEMLDRLALTEEQHYLLVKICEEESILFLSSPFDEDSVDFLDKLGVPAFKVGSGELTNRILLERVAQKKKPVILSTGMGNMDEVRGAVKVLQDNGCHEIVVLQCTTMYPTPCEEVNIRAMETIRREVGTHVGFSDHTKDDLAALLSIGAGACVIEKHFTLDATLPGPDHKASLEVPQLQNFIARIRLAEKMMGHGRKECAPCEQQNVLIARKSLAWKRCVKKGDTIQLDMLTSLRPSSGICPTQYPDLIGQIILCDCEAGVQVKSDQFQLA